MPRQKQEPCRWQLQSGLLKSLVIEEWAGNAMRRAETGNQEGIGVALLCPTMADL